RQTLAVRNKNWCEIFCCCDKYSRQLTANRARSEPPESKDSAHRWCPRAECVSQQGLMGFCRIGQIRSFIWLKFQDGPESHQCLENGGLVRRGRAPVQYFTGVITLFDGGRKLTLYVDGSRRAAGFGSGDWSFRARNLRRQESDVGGHHGQAQKQHGKP